MTTEIRGRVRTEPGAKRVRAFLGDVAVFDTSRPVLVWEGPHLPVYYVPAEDVAADLLVDSDHGERSPSRGEARFWSVRVSDRMAENAARQYPDSPFEELRDLIRFEWSAMDAWFEEDEEVFTHPRDPHHRVDILRSSRHVEVSLDGVTVADSHQPTLLFETGLPTRYYASLDRSDQDHAACRSLIERAAEPLVIPAPVLVEVDYWIHQRLTPGALVALLDDIESGPYRVVDLESADYLRVRELCDRYADSDIGFVDAAVFALVERLGESKLATLDGRHFSLLRPRHRDSIELLPD